MDQLMQGKTCIVTGANAGIGKFTALALAKMGARILMVCRNPQKGQAAQSELKAATNNKRIHLYRCDFSNLDAVRDCARSIREQYESIDVLVNNAGIFPGHHQLNADGHEMCLAVNHLGPFLFTRLLLDSLTASPAARIVNVSSKIHLSAKFDFDDPHFKHRSFNPLKAYGQSKLANILFTNELARRLKDSSVTTNSLHPGGVRTGIGSKNDNWLYTLGWNLVKPFLTSVEKGAATSVYLASAPEVENVTGKYFEKCKAVTSSKLSLDEATAKRLWLVSVEMTGY